MTPHDITVAVTVFDRREYIEQAVASALGQTLPVRVMVVEDCGPDPGLQSFVLSKFGPRITYHRNARRRGLFDNWNACLDLCSTPWLCLLHDDDLIAPDFVEAMVEVASKIEGKGLYYGKCNIVDSAGEPKWAPPRQGPHWCSPDLAQFAIRNPVLFPGEIFRSDYAKALGGFRPTSFFTADWDMWFKLAFYHGAAETSRVVGNVRAHWGAGRGTVRVVRNGKCTALNFMQVKKNVGLLRRQGYALEFDRAAALSETPLPSRYLLESASGFSRPLLAYNVGLLLLSRPPHLGYRAFKQLAACLGPGFVRAASRIYRVVNRNS